MSDRTVILILAALVGYWLLMNGLFLVRRVLSSGLARGVFVPQHAARPVEPQGPLGSYLANSLWTRYRLHRELRQA